MTNPQPTVQRMTEPHKRPYRHPTYKTAYRVKNWRAYDQSLRDRGDITVWMSQDAIDAWTPPQTGKRGAQPVYADVAIETALALRLLFRALSNYSLTLDFMKFHLTSFHEKSIV
jgi:hypothetical protein